MYQESCGAGLLMPSDPRELEGEWRCSNRECGHRHTHGEVTALVETFLGETDQLWKNNR